MVARCLGRAQKLYVIARRDLVAAERRDELRRVLRASAAKRPEVGYAQGMLPGRIIAEATMSSANTSLMAC